MSEPNYKETTVSGTSWQRACRVNIDNSYGSTPSIVFEEEKISNLDGELIRQPAGNLSRAFDPLNANHVALYEMLNNLYIELREERDSI